MLFKNRKKNCVVARKGYGSWKEYEETQIKEDVIFVKMKRMSNTYYWTV